MKVRIVPSTSDGRHQLLTTYLVNGTLAVDAGAIAIGLSREEQQRVRAIVLTHAHLDHVATLPMFITDLYEDLREPVRLFATAADYEALGRHLFHPRVWIDFETLRNEHTPLLDYHPMHSRQSFEVEGLRLTPIPVSHTVQTHGLIVEEEGEEGSAVVFTSDTGATAEIWEAAGARPRLRAVFIDLSFPDRLTELARASCHHSPSTLAAELDRIPGEATVYAIHLKAPYRDRIIEEVAALGARRLRVAEVGREYEL